MLLSIEGQRHLKEFLIDLQIVELMLQYDRNLVGILCAQEAGHPHVGMVGVETDEQMMVAGKPMGRECRERAA